MAEQADLKLRVFISSTFRDVHTERDVLTRDVFPRLAAELNAQLAMRSVGNQLRRFLIGVNRSKREQMPLFGMHEQTDLIEL